MFVRRHEAHSFQGRDRFPEPAKAEALALLQIVLDQQATPVDRPIRGPISRSGAPLLWTTIAAAVDKDTMVAKADAIVQTPEGGLDMPALRYWFSGAALGSFIALAAAVVGLVCWFIGVTAGALAGLFAAVLSLGYAWYESASSEARTAQEKIEAEQAKVLTALRREYISSHDQLSPGLLAGTEPIPAEWVNKRLSEMGHSWRVSQ